MFDYIADGQISIFDLIEPEIKEIPVILQPKQNVYIVDKGDVRKTKTLGENWLCGKGENEIYTDRGYRLMFETGGYGATWNSKIGVECFLEKELAEEKAEQYLKTHDVILGKDIKPISTVAYQYMRDADKRKMTSFYCELENGLYYLKEFMTFHHIVKNEALKKFMEQQEFKYCQPEKVEHTPNLKNMYRCTEQSDWLYAESGYSYAIG